MNIDKTFALALDICRLKRPGMWQERGHNLLLLEYGILCPNYPREKVSTTYF